MRFYLCAHLAGALLLTLAAGLVFAGDDTTPPELKSLRLTPASIDTGTGPAEVTIAFSATDDLSGVVYFEASFRDPSGLPRQSATAKFPPTLAATNSVKINFPRFSDPGTWTLANVMIGDAAGNTLVLDNQGLVRRGFPARLEVASARDTVSPTLTSLDFSPTEIDTSAGPVDVKVNYTATDDLSGVNYLEISFVSPSGVARRGGSAKLEPAKSVSNSMTVTFPRFSEPGQWTLNAVFLSDAANNTLVLDSEGVVRAGLRTNLAVTSTLDTTPPALASLAFAPETIDTTQGPATVKVDFTATDDLSGVNHVELCFMSPGGVRQTGVAKFDPAKSVSGSIVVTFPQQSQPGPWTLTMVYISDAAGNTVLLDADALASRVSKLQVR